MFKKTHRSIGKSRMGTATVEMAIVAPVIFLMIFVQIEFGRMMMIRQAVTNAARESCRHACLVTTQDTQASSEVATAFLAPVVGTDPNSKLVKVTFDPSFDSVPPRGTSIKVTVDVDFNEVSWFPPFFAKDATIQASTEMVRE